MKTKKGKQERNRKETKMKKMKNETKTNMHSGRRPIPEGTRLLFACTISPTKRPVDGPTERRHEKTRRRQDKKWAEAQI